jgi:GDP-L-fucose synthase
MAIPDEALKSFASRNILVTGGTGMIGRQVVELLMQTDACIKVVSLDKIGINKKVNHIYGDLADFNFCKEITRDMDDVFHIAGIGASVQAAEKRIATHFVPMLMMNTNLLEACRLNKVDRVVYTSSVGAYAPAEVFRESEYRLDSMPMDFAGWAKRMAEAQIYAYKMEHSLSNYSIVRPSNVYGPGDNFNPENSLVIPSLIYRVFHKEDPLIVWGDGSAIRDFVYCRDVAEGILLAMHYGTDSGFVNLGSGRPCSIQQLLKTLQEVIGFAYVFDPARPKGAQKRIMDISLAQEKIHYNPTTQLKDGLRKTWDWFLRNSEEYTQKMNYFS